MAAVNSSDADVRIEEEAEADDKGSSKVGEKKSGLRNTRECSNSRVDF